jgi:uncharacterized membrane protein
VSIGHQGEKTFYLHTPINQCPLRPFGLQHPSPQGPQRLPRTLDRCSSSSLSYSFALISVWLLIFHICQTRHEYFLWSQCWNHMLHMHFFLLIVVEGLWLKRSGLNLEVWALLAYVLYHF